jgi:A nuclease family of the HNH/ENDO VII superfamily with conserved AHH
MPEPQRPEDLVVDQRNSAILGGNLRADGQYPPGDGYEAHHMVPSRAGGERMQELRDRLAGLGLTDLNEAVNGVWLPGYYADPNAPESYHGQLNNDVYFDAVIEQFRGVTNLDEAIEILQRIASRLRDGTFPGAGQTGGKTPPSPGGK